ncbi:DNA repair protein RecO [Patescibacteria group bacterium]|nr:DNA repair protein RecO [Patescibacteria group bacterium]
MSTYLRDRAIVLTVRPYREADAWVSLWTEHHGKHDVFAAGLKRTNARQQGHLQPFSVVEVMIAHGKAFDRVAVARMTERHGASIRLTEHWQAIIGSLFAVCERMTAPSQHEPKIFAFLLECLDVSAHPTESFSPERTRLVWAFALHLLGRHLGYGVSFSRCIRCGKGPILPGAFLVKEGGFLCATCDRSSEMLHSSALSTEQALLSKGLAFFERATLEQVIHLTAPRQALVDLATILEATLTTFPVDIWQKQKAYLQSLSEHLSKR